METARGMLAGWTGIEAQNETQVSDRGTAADLVSSMVVGTGVDPVTYRFSGGRSAN